MGLGDGCGIELMFLTSWPVVEDDGGNNSSKMSCTDIHRMMFYGFELSWINSQCKDGQNAELDQYNHTVCPTDSTRSPPPPPMPTTIIPSSTTSSTALSPPPSFTFFF
ncbi:kinase-like protein [Trifolium pratense]|uniref:Kinase-like protein n=1 Tax=Trifolium pratense TaxID=57577 RepID=A0A2K3KMU6_TRIPR|nr:kinase-like protein [Trifolium pratense]